VVISVVLSMTDAGASPYSLKVTVAIARSTFFCPIFSVSMGPNRLL
jgi:hypothetical protein